MFVPIMQLCEFYGSIMQLYEFNGKQLKSLDTCALVIFLALKRSLANANTVGIQIHD